MNPHHQTLLLEPCTINHDHNHSHSGTLIRNAQYHELVQGLLVDELTAILSAWCVRAALVKS